MFGYIYKTTNLINNKIYIGQRKGEFDIKYLGSGYTLKKAIKKYGKESFKVELLIKADDMNQLNNLEIEYISKYKKIFIARDDMYNITTGGEFGYSWKGRKHTEESKDKMRLTLLRHKSMCNCFSCRIKRGEKVIRTEEHKRKIGLGNKGKKFTHNDDCNCKFCDKKGWTKGQNSPTFGRKHTIEEKNKMRLSKIGKKLSESHKEKISLGMLLAKQKRLVNA